jgi:hypothetical protein
MTPATRGAVGLALLGAVLAVLIVLFYPRVTRKMPDLEVYWTAGVRARAAEPLYRADDQHYQFKYLPAFAVLAIPLGELPLPAAKAVWLVASVLLVVALVWLSLHLLPDRRRAAWLLAVATVIVMGKFYGHEIVLGQMNALFGVVAVLALLALRDRQEARGGALVALAIVVKPYAAIFLPWLVARRRMTSIAAAAGGLALVLAVPAVTYGVPGDIALHRAWWRTVTDSTAPNLTNADNVSVAALFAKWMGVGPNAAALALAASVVILAVAAFVFLRRTGVKAPDVLEGALLLTLIPLLSPQGWDYVFLVATPAVMLLVNYSDRLPIPLRVVTFAALATIGLSLFDVMGRERYATFMAWSGITVGFFVVIAALAVLRIRKAA